MEAYGTFKIFIGGMPSDRTYRKLSKARAAEAEAKQANPSAHIVLRARVKTTWGAIGWSNVDNNLSYFIKTA